jgi:hypothetical protein
MPLAFTTLAQRAISVLIYAAELLRRAADCVAAFAGEPLLQIGQLQSFHGLVVQSPNDGCGVPAGTIKPYHDEKS